MTYVSQFVLSNYMCFNWFWRLISAYDTCHRMYPDFHKTNQPKNIYEIPPTRQRQNRNPMRKSNQITVNLANCVQWKETTRFQTTSIKIKWNDEKNITNEIINNIILFSGLFYLLFSNPYMSCHPFLSSWLAVMLFCLNCHISLGTIKL